MLGVSLEEAGATAGQVRQGRTAAMSEIPSGVSVEKLLRVGDVAKRLNLSERTVAALTKNKSLPCIRIGRSVRYCVEDLQGFIEANRTGGGA